jgi:hypothetical protein
MPSWGINCSSSGASLARLGMSLFQFRAQSSPAYTFEDFLRDAQSTGVSDPGCAMVSILEKMRVPGINLQAILEKKGLDPRNAPENLLAFLRQICEDGHWGVNLSVNID